MTSVLQDWVMELPLRAQGTLLTSVRGCDLTPKYPLDSIERQLVCAIRYAFMNPADPREIGIEPGAFFQRRLPSKWKASALGHYPQHWYAHLMHAAEIIGYCHPDPELAGMWQAVYFKLVHNLHLYPETKKQMVERLTEDRIAKGEVVS